MDRKKGRTAKTCKVEPLVTNGTKSTQTQKLKNIGIRKGKGQVGRCDGAF